LQSSNNETILPDNFSAVLNPCENNITYAIKSLSGLTMAIYLNNYFKFSGKLDLPAYPGFIVMNIPIVKFNLTSLFMRSIFFYLSLNPV